MKSVELSHRSRLIGRLEELEALSIHLEGAIVGQRLLDAIDDYLTDLGTEVEVSGIRDAMDSVDVPHTEDDTYKTIDRVAEFMSTLTKKGEKKLAEVGPEKFSGPSELSCNHPFSCADQCADCGKNISVTQFHQCKVVDGINE